MSDMYQSDHDTLIKLQSTIEAHIAHEGAVSRQVVAELAKLSEKFDQMSRTLLEQARDIKDLKSGQTNLDIRVATLAQQVDTLSDEAEKAKAVAEAKSKTYEQLAKRWAIVSGVVVFIISNGPTLLAWLQRIISPTP